MLDQMQVDIDSLGDQIKSVVETAAAAGTQTVEVENTQFKKFHNIIHFVTDPEGLAVGTLWENPRQYQMLCEFYSLFCPQCNKPNDHPDPAMRWDRWGYTPSQLQEDVLFVRDDNYEYACPQCGLKQKDAEVPQYNTLLLKCGMRSGKTILGGMVTLWEVHSDLMLDNPQKRFGLVPNQLITYSLATTQGEQGVQTIFGAVDGFHKNSPWFTHYNAALKKAAEDMHIPFDKVYVKNLDEIRYLNKSLIISVSGSNSAALAGRTRKLVVIDEIARFVSTDSRMGVDLVYDTLEASLLTLSEHGAKMVCISSPMWEEDKICKLYRDAAEKKAKNILFREYPTWLFNPKLPRDHPFILEKYDRDPVAANRDYGCVAPGVESAWIPDGWRIDQCVDPKVPRLVVDDITHSSLIVAGKRTDLIGKRLTHKDLTTTKNVTIACDPGYRGDSFGVVLAYIQKVRTVRGMEDHIMIGGVLAWEPVRKPPKEVDFLNVQNVIRECCKWWNVDRVVYDQWNSISSIQQLRSEGVHAEQIPLKKEDWELFATLIYQQQIHFLDPTLHGAAAKRLIWELKHMVQKENGKVDHSPNSSSDLAVCVARAVKVLVGEDASAKRMWDLASAGARAVHFNRP